MPSVSFDELAKGMHFKIGEELHRKVTDFISVNERTGQLLFDARICGYPKAEAPMVEPVFQLKAEAKRKS